MIYAEFIERDRRIPLEIHHVFSRQEQWSGDGDEKVVNIARTKAIGPPPACLCCWRIRDISRMDEWEAHFRSAEGRQDVAEWATYHALDFQRAGLYDEVIETAMPAEGLHLVEFFRPDETVPDEEIRRHFAERGKAHSAGRPSALLRRVGLLGPDPGGVAIWTFPNYAQMEKMARDAHGESPLKPTAAGLYRNVGQESI